jgi:hypothetical protein
MVVSAPRLDARLVAAAFVLDDPEEPYAETCRRVGAVASELGLPRPSYDTVRLLVRVNREVRADIRSLLTPVAIDLLNGRLSLWDVDRVREAVHARRGRAA